MKRPRRCVWDGRGRSGIVELPVNPTAILRGSGGADDTRADESESPPHRCAGLLGGVLTHHLAGIRRPANRCQEVARVTRHHDCDNRPALSHGADGNPDTLSSAPDRSCDAPARMIGQSRPGHGVPSDGLGDESQRRPGFQVPVAGVSCLSHSTDFSNSPWHGGIMILWGRVPVLDYGAHDRGTGRDTPRPVTAAPSDRCRKPAMVLSAVAGVPHASATSHPTVSSNSPCLGARGRLMLRSRRVSMISPARMTRGDGRPIVWSRRPERSVFESRRRYQESWAQPSPASRYPYSIAPVRSACRRV
jgi:hypothetical protein